MWQGPMEVLSCNWRVAGVDQRGSRETLCSPESISLSAMVGDLFRVMDALDIERCVLGSESHGMTVVVIRRLVDHSRAILPHGGKRSS
jgi:hypothetical protein